MPISRAAIAAGMAVQVPQLWTFGFLLYPITGVAAWMVWRRIDVGLSRKRAALRAWGWQLLLGSLWPAALYGVQSPALATAIVCGLLVLAFVTLFAFRRLQPGAALLLTPYCAWLLCLALLTAPG